MRVFWKKQQFNESHDENLTKFHTGRFTKSRRKAREQKTLDRFHFNLSNINSREIVGPGYSSFLYSGFKNFLIISLHQKIYICILILIQHHKTIYDPNWWHMIRNISIICFMKNITVVDCMHIVYDFLSRTIQCMNSNELKPIYFLILIIIVSVMLTLYLLTEIYHIHITIEYPLFSS